MRPMSDKPTPFVETEALVACLASDDQAALAVIGNMHISERRALKNAADRLAELADPWNWCPGCHQYAPLRGRRLVFLSQGRFRWHSSCHEAAKATGEL